MITTKSFTCIRSYSRCARQRPTMSVNRGLFVKGASLTHLVGWNAGASLTHLVGWNAGASLTHLVGWNAGASLTHLVGWNAGASLTHLVGWNAELRPRGSDSDVTCVPGPRVEQCHRNCTIREGARPATPIFRLKMSNFTPSNCSITPCAFLRGNAYMVIGNSLPSCHCVRKVP